MQWKAIVFDLDDTLYPEKEFVLSGFHAVSLWVENEFKMKRNIVKEEFIEHFNEGIRKNIFNLWLESKCLFSEERLQKMINIYRYHNPSISPFPEVKNVLTTLKKRFLLGIVSDGYLEVQEKKLNALGIRNYFDAVIFSDQLGRDAWKPSTKPFEEIVNRLRLFPKECIYVADNPLKDFIGAKKIGMFTVRIIRNNGIYSSAQSPSSEHAPDYIINNLNELLTIV